VTLTLTYDLEIQQGSFNCWVQFGKKILSS